MAPRTPTHAGTALIRVALGLVFLWFGLTGLLTADALVGYVPAWAPGDPYTLVMLNGIFDTLLAVVLLIGWRVRIFGIIAALHLLVIGVGVGYNDVMVRDIGLALIALGVAFNPPDAYTIDARQTLSGK